MNADVFLRPFCFKARFLWRRTQLLFLSFFYSVPLTPPLSDVHVLGQDWGNNTHKRWECLESALQKKRPKVSHPTLQAVK